MKCDSPLLILNKYTNKFLKVGCRKCDSCLIASANAKSLLLANELSKGWITLFVTLTYDNEHIPVVFYGDNKIYRSPNGTDLELVEEMEDILDLYPREPYKYPFVDCTGVIYYKDFQDFFKRLRRKLEYNGKGNFKYFICCEYGTVHKRPHAHCLLFFKPRDFYSGVTDYIIESWKMCSEAVLREGIKVADGRVSSYLAAYVNSNSKHYPLAQHPLFRQKTRRSAYLDYGCSFEDKKEIKRVIKSGLFDRSFNDDSRPFEYIDYSKFGRFSTCFVSERVFSTYFRKCYGFSTLSINALCLRLRNIYKFCSCIKSRINELPFSYCIDGYFHQADFNWFRGYLAFLDLMNMNDSTSTLNYYLWLYPRMIALYESQVLRRYMLNYEHQTPNNYFLDAFNTEYRKIGSSDWYSGLLLEYDVKYVAPFSSDTSRKLYEYKIEYGKRLIPKHRNSIYNVNF